MFKRFIVLLCCGLFLMGIGSPVYALDGTTDEPVPTEPTRYNSEYYTDNNYHAGGYEASPFVRPMSASASIYDQAWASSGVAVYYQDDIPSSYTCSSGTPLSEVGCAVTSFAMVLAKYGIYKTPEDVFSSLLSTGGIQSNCNMTWSTTAFSNAFSGLNMDHWTNTVGGWYLESVGMDVIETQIRDYNRPVIVHLKQSGSDFSHYVVCYGYEKYNDGGIFHYIYNPSRGAYTTLEDYMATKYIADFTVFYW